MAGVVNLTLRDDFEGIEVTANFEQPQHAGGDIYQASFLAGAKSDRSRIVFSAEWFERERVLAGDRDFSSSLREVTIGPDGQRRTISRSGFFDNVIVAPGSLGTAPPGTVAGSGGDVFFFYTPGRTDIGVPNFSSGIALPAPQAPLFDPGVPPSTGTQGFDDRFPFIDFYNDQDERRRSDLVGDLNRFSIVTLGSFDFNAFGNSQIYYEAYYLNRRTFSQAATEQIFPDIRGTIPLVNLRDPNGPVSGAFDPVIAGGQVVRVDNPLNPFAGDVAPILTLDSVPQNREVELEQFRFVSGFRGDVDAGWFGANNWSYDTYFTYDRGIGFQSQPILFEPNLELTTLNLRQIANGPNAGQLACNIPNDTDQNGAFLTSNACVPVNFFAPNIFTGGRNGEGAFTAEEEAFLIGTRTNRTVIEQFIWNGFVSGDLFKSPWGGVVTGGLGAEWRRDVIRSQNSTDGVFGTNAAESPSTEGDTNGARRFYEFFGEVNIPLIEDKPFIYSLNIDGAVRYTNESNFGDDVTYRARGQYRPTEWLSFSGAYGTSFRAPNLREQFLADQGGGVSGALDPCLDVNIRNTDDAVLGLLIPNCIASGVQFTDSDGDGQPDATVLGTQGVTTIPTISGGNSNLVPETSRSYTISGSISQPWWDEIDLSLAVSYYDIRIRNTVSQPPADFIIDNCFLDADFPNLTSPFCSLLTRPGGAAASNIINSVDVSFFNIGEQTARGLDFNTRLGFDLPFAIGGTPIRFTHATTASYQLEAEIETFEPSDRDDNVGEIGSPRFRFNNVATLNWGRWGIIVENRRIGAANDDDGAASVFAAPIRFLDQFPVQSTAARVAAGNVIVDFVDPVWYHDVSLSYSHDRYSITFGVNNIGDRDPPIVNSSLDNQRNSAVTSSGYDLFGRTFFINGAVRF